MMRTYKEENKGAKKEERCSKEVKDKYFGWGTYMLREKG